MNELVKNGELKPQVIMQMISLIEKQKAAADALDAIKGQILEEMKAQGIVKIQTPEILINYIAPTTRESLDSKKLKEELPEIYDEYCKISNVKESLKVKI